MYRSDGGWAGAVHRESFICNVCGSFTRGVCGLVCVLGFGGVSMSDDMYVCSAQRVSCVGLGLGGGLCQNWFLKNVALGILFS